MSIIVNSEINALLHIPSKNEGRHHFRGVIANKNGIMATDTRLLVRLPVQSNGGDETVWLTAETLRGFLKNLKKDHPKYVVNLSVEKALPDNKKSNTINAKAVSIFKNGEKASVTDIDIANNIDNWPLEETKKLFDKAKKNKHLKMSVLVESLEKMVKALKGVKAQSVDLYFGKSDKSPAYFTTEWGGYKTPKMEGLLSISPDRAPKEES